MRERQANYDLFVVIPGLMGSSLVNADPRNPRVSAPDGRAWGFSDLGGFARFWADKDAGRALALRPEDDLSVRYPGGLKPDGLLWTPAAAAVFGGASDYRALVEKGSELARGKPAGLLRFAYDWRLSVKRNARELAFEIAKALSTWRKDPIHRAHDREVRAFIVAHSMGGLLAAALKDVAGDDAPPWRGTGRVPDVTGEISTTITLGTPFRGSVKALVALADGSAGPPLVADEILRDISRTFPGMYDLLPDYMCVDAHTHARRLTADDVSAIGGSGEYADEALSQNRRPAPPRHLGYAGANHETLLTATFDAGGLRAHTYQFALDDAGRPIVRDGAPVRVPGAGDGTVGSRQALPSDAASQDPYLLPQAHGLLHDSKLLLEQVDARWAERLLGPVASTSPPKLDVPAAVAAGASFEVRLRNVEHAPTTRVMVESAVAGGGATPLPVRWHEDEHGEHMVATARTRDDADVLTVTVIVDTAEPLVQHVLASRHS